MSYHNFIPILSIPLQVAGCTLWYDISDTTKVVVSAGTVTDILDKSVSGNNATQANAGLRFITSTVNGLQVIYGSRTSDTMTLTNGVASLSAQTIFVVAQSKDPSNAHVHGIFCDPVSNAVFMNFGARTGLDDNSSPGSYALKLDISLSDPGHPSLFTATHSGTAQSTILYVDQIQLTSLLVASGAWNSSAWGAIKNMGSSIEVILGYIGEIIIYNSVLGSSDLAKVSNYLKAKWGTP